MPVIKGPNNPNADGERTRQIGSEPAAHDPYGEKTVAVGRQERTARTTPIASAQSGRGDEEKTKVFGAQKSAKPVGTGDAEDPVVAWLVVVKGPGKGRSLSVGYGRNAIGRGAEQRIRLDFGDDAISREAQAFVTYDPRGRKFYLQGGDGTNLIYIGNSPVLAPMELTESVDLTMGNTTLRFVPFCGPHFDWQESY